MPVLEALTSVCRGPGGEDAIQVLRSHAPHWVSQMPGLNPTADQRALDQSVQGAAPERMLRELAEALEAMSARRACVLLLEDLHWADYSTLDLISYIAQRSGSAALLVTATYRPLEAFTSLDHRASVLNNLRRRTPCAELRLAHLDEQAISEYLARRFPGHALPVAFTRLLRLRTSGNPLFVCRVVDGWLQKGVLGQANDRTELGAQLLELSRHVPESVSMMIEDEIERLPPFEQMVLQAAFCRLVAWCRAERSPSSAMWTQASSSSSRAGRSFAPRAPR